MHTRIAVKLRRAEQEAKNIEWKDRVVAKGRFALVRFCCTLRAGEIGGGQGRNRHLCDFAARCARAKSVVAKGGIEPPTQGFSVLCSTD
jgi:hypothetical protein